MPFARTKEFYDLVGNGLAYAGYSGETAFNEFVNDVFAKKYNSASTFEHMLMWTLTDLQRTSTKLR